MSSMSTKFDPRLAPMAPLLPEAFLVPPGSLSPEALRARFASPPAWEPDAHLERWLKEGQPVQASVLLPLVVREVEGYGPMATAVLLTQRNADLRHHGGQISFPGGRRDPEDADEVATALREAQEEVGLAPERIEVIGRLPNYETGTGFMITPVVGLIHAKPHETDMLDLKTDPGEVAEVFEVPLSFLLDSNNHQRRALQVGEQELSFFAMPWWPSHREEDYFIWGATAAMLRNFYRFLVV